MKIYELSVALTLVFIVMTIAFMSYSYYPTTVYHLYGYLAAVIGGASAVPLMFGRKRFGAVIKNPIVVLCYGSIPILLFITVRSLVGVLSAAIYIMFIVISLVLVDMEDIEVLETEPGNIKRFAIGLSVGAIAAAVIYNIYGYMGAELLIGYIPYTLSSILRSVPLFFIMLFMVAVPEELLFRLFIQKVGSAASMAIVSPIASGVMWYAMHAITRYQYPIALFMVCIVGAVLIILYTVLGLYASIAAHAMYNVVVYALYEFSVYGYAVVLLAIAISIAFMIYEKKPVNLSL
ncbi:MAG: CPBP family intramembrane glutamic endopeptidase [Ignisphaera sp.]